MKSKTISTLAELYFKTYGSLPELSFWSWMDANNFSPDQKGIDVAHEVLWEELKKIK